MCLPSKAAVLLVCLTVVVGAINTILTILCVLAAVVAVDGLHIDKSLSIFIFSLCGIVVVILYPVSGFLADVYCGRFRVVMISMCFFIVSFVLLSGAAALVLVAERKI